MERGSQTTSSFSLIALLPERTSGQFSHGEPRHLEASPRRNSTRNSVSFPPLLSSLANDRSCPDRVCFEVTLNKFINEERFKCAREIQKCWNLFRIMETRRDSYNQ